MSSPTQVLQPAILSSNILGTLPYTRTLKLSSFLLFCSIFLNAVSCVYRLDSAMTILKQIEYLPAHSALVQIAKIINCISSAANLYFVFRSRAKFLLILSTFEEIHKMFKFSGVGLQKPRRQVQLTICIILALAWSITLLDIAVSPNKQSTQNWTSAILSRFIATTLHSLSTQFLSFSILIHFYMKQINSRISELQIFHLACTKNKITSKQIEDLRAAHNKLCENAHLINQVYGIYLLLPLSFMSIHLQTDFFSIISTLIERVNDFPYKSLRTTNWVISMLWTINDFTKLCFYFRAAYLVHKEVKIFTYCN
jgi:7tm Chemosensory receptor